MNLKQYSCLVYDFGLFSGLAERLAQDFGKVGYFVPWETSFSDGREFAVGMGLPNVERVIHWDDAVNHADLLVFPDVLCSDLQEYYRRQSKIVWGAGRGSELELLRWKTKQRLKSLGLPVNPCAKLVGTAALRTFLSDQRNQCWYVKVSTFRGLGETCRIENYESACAYIDVFNSEHGALQHIVEFIVEAEIPDADEIGYDGYCIDGQFPEQAVCGAEVKDKAYFGRVGDSEELPDGVWRVNNALAPVLRELGYRQFFSTEIRQKGGKSYLIDVTARHASPAGEIYCALFENLSEIIWWGSQGTLLEPQISNQYGAQLVLSSSWALDHWTPISFPEEIRPWVKLYNHSIIEGTDYFVPQTEKMEQIGSVIAVGNDPDEVCETCIERAKSIQALDLEFDEAALEKARELIEKDSAPV